MAKTYALTPALTFNSESAPSFFEVAVLHKITRFVNASDDHAARLQVHFRNGFVLSIIRGKRTYGGWAGLFEVALWNQAGTYVTQLLDGSTPHNNVLGWQTAAEVMGHVEKVSQF